MKHSVRQDGNRGRHVDANGDRNNYQLCNPEDCFKERLLSRRVPIW
jgi:hypothetical protein